MTSAPPAGRTGVTTTFVLIPGAGGQAWYWHRLVAELERRGHSATAVDLPAGDESAGLSAYTDTVVAAIGDRSPVVLVAQSMGGLTAPLVCARVPVELLVLVNAMVPLPGETGGEWWTATGQAEAHAAHARQEGLPDDPDADFFHDVPAEVARYAQAQPFAQSTRPFEDPWPLTGWPDVPTRVVVGRDDRFFPADFQRRIAAERLGIEADETPGGHLVALSRPVELADRLEGYLSGPR
jgi:pimeloyl-ACP methyl ester carboxylesterase